MKKLIATTLPLLLILACSYFPGKQPANSTTEIIVTSAAGEKQAQQRSGNDL